MIRLKDAAQGYVATYLRQPELAKKNPKRIFQGTQDGGSFEKIFSSDLTAERFVSTYRVSKAINGFIKQFMTRKRRRDRVADWRQDYSTLLGPEIVGEFGDVLDQVVPQSAVFLSALAFEEWVRLRGKAISELLDTIDSGDFSFVNHLLHVILRYAKGQPGLAKSWPTLLKSQSFFDQVAGYLKGLVDAEPAAAVPRTAAKRGRPAK